MAICCVHSVTHSPRTWILLLIWYRCVAVAVAVWALCWSFTLDDDVWWRQKRVDQNVFLNNETDHFVRTQYAIKFLSLRISWIFAFNGFSIHTRAGALNTTESIEILDVNSHAERENELNRVLSLIPSCNQRRNILNFFRYREFDLFLLISIRYPIRFRQWKANTQHKSRLCASIEFDRT